MDCKHRKAEGEICCSKMVRGNSLKEESTLATIKYLQWSDHVHWTFQVESHCNWMIVREQAKEED
jgi:hypothetical protein